MNKPKISVIIPIYNVEEYIGETLNNLLNQTFFENIEVLMIDDGSTDNSRFIIEKYAMNYDNFHAFHKKNEGSGIARNFGLELANGEYVHFLDSDDVMSNDWYEQMYSIAVENDSDMVTSPIVRLTRYDIFEGIYYKNSIKNIDRDYPSTKFKNHPDLIWELFVINKLFKRDFLNSNNLRFINYNKVYCDDAPFCLKSYMLSDSISILTKPFYYWRIRREENPSQTQKFLKVKNFKDRICAAEMFIKIIKNENLAEEFAERLYLKILNYDLYIHFSQFHKYDSEHYSEIIDEASEVLKIIPDKYKSKLNSFKRVMYAMVENKEIEGLCNLSSLDLELKLNPHIPENIDEKYVQYFDFDRDVKGEELIFRKEDAFVENDNLFIEFYLNMNYLSSDYSYDAKIMLVDEDNNEYLLDVEDNFLAIPLDLINDKGHMKIKVEFKTADFYREEYMKNYYRKVISLDDYDIEIGIETNRTFCIDIRQTSDLNVDINRVSLVRGFFEFSGRSNGFVDEVFIQNVISFERIYYDVDAIESDGEYNVTFSIPYEDLLSFQVRKWELMVKEPFKVIKLDKLFEFYNDYDRVEICNIRNKILLSQDFYDLFEKSKENGLMNDKDLNAELVRENNELSSEIKGLSNEITGLTNEKWELSNELANVSNRNSKLLEDNSRLKQKINEYKSRKVVRIVDKIKRFLRI